MLIEVLEAVFEVVYIADDLFGFVGAAGALIGITVGSIGLLTLVFLFVKALVTGEWSW